VPRRFGVILSAIACFQQLALASRGFPLARTRESDTNRTRLGVEHIALGVGGGTDDTDLVAGGNDLE
jgi:hypothetical protein